MELARRLENGQLKLNDPTLIEEIHTTLHDGSGGMFLWVVLQMDCICYEETDERIRSSLTKLPKTLPELYARILSRAAQHDTYHDQDRGFRLILAAFRPLKKDEIGEALGVVPGDTTYDPRRHAHDVDRLLARCASLIVVDGEYHTVQLIHQSARTYLMVDHVPADGLPMNEDSVHQAMADIAITYLNYGVFDTQVSTNVITTISAQAVQKRVVESVLKSSTSKLAALRLLHKISGADFNLNPSLDSCGVADDEKPSDQQVLFPFHHYAKEYFALHALVYNPLKPMEIKNLLIKLLGRKIITPGPLFTWESYSLNDLAGEVLGWIKPVQLILTQDQNQQNLITWCLQNNHQHLARYCSILVNDQYGFEAGTTYVEKISRCICLAVEKTNYEIASILFYNSILQLLLEDYSIELTFSHELLRLWREGNFEAVKWIGDHIVKIGTSSYDPILGEMTKKSDSFAGALHKADMFYWQQQLANNFRALDAFLFVVSVPLVNYLCKKSIDRPESEQTYSVRERGSVIRLRDLSSREVTLHHLEKWDKFALAEARIELGNLLSNYYSEGRIVVGSSTDYQESDAISSFIEQASEGQDPLTFRSPPWIILQQARRLGQRGRSVPLS